MDEEKIIINKYGMKVHDVDNPFFDMVEDTRMCINPDIDHVIEVAKKIKENDGRCPSKFVPNSQKVLAQDTRCPCSEFLCQGKCECGLFIPLPIVPVEVMEKMIKEANEHPLNRLKENFINSSYR